MKSVIVGGLGVATPFAGISYRQAIPAEVIGTFLFMLTIIGELWMRERCRALPVW